MDDYYLLTDKYERERIIRLCVDRYGVSSHKLEKYYVKHGPRIALQEGDVDLALALFDESKYKSTGAYELMKFAYTWNDAALVNKVTRHVSSVYSHYDARMYEPLPPETFMDPDESVLRFFMSLPRFDDYLQVAAPSVIAGLEVACHHKTREWVLSRISGENAGPHDRKVVYDSKQARAMYEASFGIDPIHWTTHLATAPPEVVVNAIRYHRPFQVDLKRAAKSLVAHQNYDSLAAINQTGLVQYELQPKDVKTLGCLAVMAVAGDL